MKRESYIRATDVLYRLTTICYQCKPEARYPCFEVRREVAGYFHSLADAERRIRHYITENEKSKYTNGYSHDYYGFVVDEIPFDWYLSGVAQCTRTYLDDGSLFAQTKVSDLCHHDSQCYEPFKGRKAEECPFEVGDLVEVLLGDTVSLEIVYSQPSTVERASEIRHNAYEQYKQERPDLTEEQLVEVMDRVLDFSDDSYITLDGDEGYMPNHSHPLTIQLFPVRRKVPYLLRKKLERGLEIALKENETYLC